MVPATNTYAEMQQTETDAETIRIIEAEVRTKTSGAGRCVEGSIRETARVKTVSG